MIDKAKIAVVVYDFTKGKLTDGEIDDMTKALCNELELIAFNLIRTVTVNYIAKH